MAEYSPMMQHYLQRKNIKTVSYFTDWVTSMKCFLMMHLSYQKNWN